MSDDPELSLTTKTHNLLWEFLGEAPTHHDIMTVDLAAFDMARGVGPATIEDIEAYRSAYARQERSRER